MTAIVRCIGCEDPSDDICPATSSAHCARVTIFHGVPTCLFVFSIAACDMAAAVEMVDARVKDARMATDDYVDDSGWDK